MRHIMTDIAALTNAITDITVEVDEAFLGRYGLRKASFNHTRDYEASFKDELSRMPHEITPAGSSANVLFNLASFGLYTSLLGTVGDDAVGENYLKAIYEARIYSLINISRGPSAVCYVMITPDHERTMLTKIGVAYRYDFNLSKLDASKIFHTSGFELLTNPERTLETIDHAKAKGAKISFDLSDPVVITRHRDDLESVLDKTDILFATTEEAGALTGIYTDSSLDELKDICPIVALKKGKDGSIVTDGKSRHIIPAYPVRLVNTNGAGDAYAAGFLYSYFLGESIETCGQTGSCAASTVCGRKESHL
jgi:sugar/nucleoside kinase (ribokinase family)